MNIKGVTYNISSGTLCLIALFSSGFSSENHTLQNELRLIQSDALGVVIEYMPQYLPPSTYWIDGREFTTVTFEGGKFIENLSPGAPAILYRSILLNFHGSQNNTVEILNVEYEEIPNILLLPAPQLVEDDFSFHQKYLVDENEYSSSNYVPPQVALLTDVGETRGVFLGSLRFYPLQYNAGLRKLRKYSKIVVRVSYGTSEPTIILQDELTDGVTLNEKKTMKKLSQSAHKTSTAPRNSVLAVGEWFRFPIMEEGLYKFTGTSLLSLGIPRTTNPHNIKIYGNGGYELPRSVSALTADDLIENAVYTYDAGNNEQLDPDDYIIFFGKSTRGWTYNPTTRTLSHYINRYTETNYYWLTYGNAKAKTMSNLPSVTASTNYKPTTVDGKIFREEDKINILHSGIEWLGQFLNAEDAVEYVHTLPGIDHSQPIRYTFRLGARSNTVSTFTIYEHGTRLTSLNIPGTVVGSYSYTQLQTATAVVRQLPTFTDNQIKLRFLFSTASTGGSGYIDWYEILYSRFLQAQNDVLEFHTADTNAIAEYTVSGFSSNQIFVFDVSKFDSVLIVTNNIVDGNTCTFRVQLQQGLAKQFYVVGQNGFKTPPAPTRVSNQNLQGDTSKVDYIIVTHSEFASAAQRLKKHREQTGDEMLRTRIVDVDQIYNEFGGGLPSPMAIRNYLKYVYLRQTQPPKYVLLFGDGDFDYKRILGKTPNWIPPFETQESFVPINSYPTDDDFVIFESTQRVSMGIGRLTVQSLREANAVVDKIIAYETQSVNDPWKLRVTLVADDGPAGSGGHDGFTHTDQAEGLSRLVPSYLEPKKIYAYQYPTVYTSVGRRKPAVNQAIQRQINQGTLVLNFTGHGNPRVWAHEQIFVRETDFPLLQNKNKYFFLVAATCNYSQFDRIDEQSSGELLVTLPNAGAAATFSASRAVYAWPNYILNQELYRNLFRTAGERVLPQRLGDVIFRLKQNNTDPNDRKYLLIGDPALRLAFPKLYATIDSVKHQPTTTTVQLEALNKVNVHATVRNSVNQKESTINGTSTLVVYDSEKRIFMEDSVRNDNGTITYFRTNFTLSGDILFHGEQSVRNGTISSTFIVPKDISYSNNKGRMTVYFWNNQIDGAGFTRNIVIGGTDSSALPDNKGPDIRLYLNTREFRAGDLVNLSPLLIADFFDSSGINTSAAGIGHRIEAWLDNSAHSIDLTNYYKSKIDTYQEGTVEYQLPELDKGSHRIQVRAWDTYNNASISETVFDVVTRVGLQITNVHNYPNPFSSQTLFTFEHNQISAINAEIKIYTVAGRLIQTLSQYNVTDRTVKLLWDGRDRDGDAIANGVYLYKVIVRTSDGRFTNETIGKLSVLR